MRHILWLMPLTLGITLMIWCLLHPIHHHNTYGRECLAITIILLSLFIKLSAELEQRIKI